MEQDIKADIRNASFKLFAKLSYSKTTVSDIASEAGIGKGTVYLYYKNKEDILSDIFDEMINNYIENGKNFFFSGEYNFEEKLLEFVSCFTGSFFEMKNILVGAMDNIKSDFFKEVFSSFNNHRDKIISFLVQMIQKSLPLSQKLSKEELYLKAGDYFDYLIARATLYVLETDWNNSDAIKNKLREHAVPLFHALVL
jgi:AcrR family transcriptional regulator